MGATTVRAVVHVGTPKSGTTFLQRALWAQREALAAAGVHLPGEREREMFLAAIEVREAFRFWGRSREELTGTWQRLCDQARSADGTTVLSHEVLSAATRDQAARALEALDGLEVHLLVTARDLGRQLMSGWQEDVKNGRTESFDEYQADVLARLRRSDLRGRFWSSQDLVGVLDRWAGSIPAERVHLVTAPPAGSPPELLWERFAAAVAFDPGEVGVPERASGANRSLGTQQIAALRRVNRALDGRVRHPHYGRVVKRRFAQQYLAAQPGTRPECPVATVEELRAHAEEVIATLAGRGYRVHGDLKELLPVPADAGAPHPDDVSADAELESLAAAAAELLVHQAQTARPGRAAGRGRRRSWRPSPRLAQVRRGLRRLATRADS